MGFTGGVERGRVNREQISLKVATVNAKIRTAKAKARAIRYALQTRARRVAETEKAEVALKKAVAAFITRWKRKREKADAKKAAKLARMAALKARIAVKKVARKEKDAVKKAAEKAKL